MSMNVRNIAFAATALLILSPGPQWGADGSGAAKREAVPTGGAIVLWTEPKDWPTRNLYYGAGEKRTSLTVRSLS